MGAINPALGSLAETRTRLVRVVRGEATVRGRDVLRDAYVVFAIFWMVLTALGYFQATDARSWYDHKLPYPYDVTDYQVGYGFWFAPPIAFAIYPLTLLPWPIYAALFVGLSLAALGYVGGRWAIVLVLFPPVFWELEAGNVNLLIAAAMVLGLRYSASWSFVLLTKVTPGVGLVWFAARRQWRPLAVAGGSTLLIALVTFALRPDLWFDWWAALSSNAGWAGPAYFTVPVPLSLRLLAAIPIALFAGLTDRAWLLPVAVTLGLPVLWFNGLSILVAAVPLLASRASPTRRPAPA